MRGKNAQGEVPAGSGQAGTTGETPTQTSVPVTAGEGVSFQEAFAEIKNDKFVIQLLFVWNALEFTAKEANSIDSLPLSPPITKAPSYIYTYTRGDLDLLQAWIVELNNSLYKSSDDGEFAFLRNNVNVSRQAYVNNIERYKTAIQSMIEVDNCRMDQGQSLYRMHPALPFFDEKLSLLLRYQAEIKQAEIKPAQKSLVDNPEEEAGVSRNSLSLFGEDTALDLKPPALESETNQLAQLIVLRQIAQTPTAITLSALNDLSGINSDAELMKITAHYRRLMTSAGEKYTAFIPAPNAFTDDYQKKIAAKMKEVFGNNEQLIERALDSAFCGVTLPMNSMPQVFYQLNRQYREAIEAAIKKVEAEKVVSFEDAKLPAGPALQ